MTDDIISKEAIEFTMTCIEDWEGSCTDRYTYEKLNFDSNAYRMCQQFKALHARVQELERGVDWNKKSIKPEEGTTVLVKHKLGGGDNYDVGYYNGDVKDFGRQWVISNVEVLDCHIIEWCYIPARDVVQERQAKLDKAIAALDKAFVAMDGCTAGEVAADKSDDFYDGVLWAFDTVRDERLMPIMEEIEQTLTDIRSNNDE